MSDLLGGVSNAAKVGDKNNSKLKVQRGKEEHSEIRRQNTEGGVKTVKKDGGRQNY